ncbi:MAG: L-serine ammonia-lyase [Gammaproteobacteria bacterium]|nr:L-serine ammonia-lyase [Gammaproteobacteria bacterium]
MAAISIFDIFKIGIGPSSSHTVGPMKAARAFASELDVDKVGRLVVRLHGSLAWTGRGHGTDKAIILGLSGFAPETIDPDGIDAIVAAVSKEKQLALGGEHNVAFDPNVDIEFDREQELPRHTNGMRFTALAPDSEVLKDEVYYSLGGGFIARGDEPEAAEQSGDAVHEFSSAAELLQVADAAGLSIAQLVCENEKAWRAADEVNRRMDAIWSAMQSCIDRGLKSDGVLPGSIEVVRRAPKLYRSLNGDSGMRVADALTWANAFAIAVNEENAAGGRVVTSPTNGAAGIIPAVMMYYWRFVPGADEDGIRRFLLTAGAIAVLYKINASISGAEMGCQGEVGVACSMAAGGLAAALGGDNRHVEQAAEIGMEHNLGLTCDPVGGLVQIPCIERNAMGAVKAINAATLAMHGDGTHKVSLDQVIETMRQTGIDMSTSYKETSKGGLAVNVPEC